MAASQRPEDGEDRAVYIISVAAELAGVHPQTLRMYERKGLVEPSRTRGNTRRYSERDIARLRAVQELTKQQGINLAGAKMIMEMQAQVEQMRSDMDRLRSELLKARKKSPSTSIVPLRSIQFMPWQEGLMR